MNTATVVGLALGMRHRTEYLSVSQPSQRQLLRTMWSQFTTEAQMIPDRRTVSRRGFLSATGLTSVAFAFRPIEAYAQHEGDHLVVQIRDAAATAKIEVQSLRGNISVLIGSGGNIAVLPGRDGKLLVDAGIPGTRSEITKALSALSGDPNRHLINTHWHFDHTDGNEWLSDRTTFAGLTQFAFSSRRARLPTDWNERTYRIGYS